MTNTCLEVISACLPQCNSNQDCGGGLYCDPSDGSCKTTSTTGKPVGATCTQNLDAGVDDCKGDCIGFVHDSSGSPFTYMCAEKCTLGASPSCGWDGPGTGSPAPAACLFVSTVILDNGGSGVGDVGSCGQLCNCNSDCLNSALVCESFGNVQAESFYQKKGFCSDPLQTDGGLSPGIACP
ncbi:MAG: hypothetical protein EHM50_10080 [Lysobacterales bacterium]|nr:MAG: hypothetical protein EHM50_10080 [Xanthomonadales bacterium]